MVRQYFTKCLATEKKIQLVVIPTHTLAPLTNCCMLAQVNFSEASDTVFHHLSISDVFRGRIIMHQGA